MWRSIVVLVAVGVFIGCDALANLGQTSCDVYELENVQGLCVNADACKNYCQRTVGAELLAAECSDPRPNGQRECVCRTKCCNSGCWGDPHCWTCDGVKFGYQGMKKHFIQKPIKDYPNFPYYDIRQINRVWEKGPMSILDISEVTVRDWKLVIELKLPDPNNPQHLLKVNDEVQNIPYRFSKIEGHREKFVNIVFGNPQKTQVVLTTSFGLRIVYTTNGAGATIYSDLSIDTPRHPELKDKYHGVLGRWNGNPDDDSVDATGKKQPLDERFSWAFGDSWIVPGGRTQTPDCVRDDAGKKHDKQDKEVSPKVKARAEKFCKTVLEHPDLVDCAKKLNRAVPLVKNCITDLIYMKSREARIKYVNLLVKSFAETCARRNLGKGKNMLTIKFDFDDDNDDDSDEDGPGKGKGKPHHGKGDGDGKGKPHHGKGDGKDDKDGHGKGKDHGKGHGKDGKGRGGKSSGDDDDDRGKGKGKGRDDDDDDDGKGGKHGKGKDGPGKGRGGKSSGDDDDDRGKGKGHGGKGKGKGGDDGDDDGKGGKHHGKGDGDGKGKGKDGPGGKGRGGKSSGDDDDGRGKGKGKDHGKGHGKDGHGGKGRGGKSSGDDDDDRGKGKGHGGKGRDHGKGDKDGHGKGKGDHGDGKHKGDHGKGPGKGDGNDGKGPGNKGNNGDGGNQKNPDCTPSLVPVYRFYHPPSDDHFYTTNYAEATGIIPRGYVAEGIPGYVAVNNKDCRGNAANYKPVYRLYKPGAKDDHFYTQNEQEANNAAAGGYVREGIAFFCPAEASKCGANLAFRRMFRGTDHFYTTDAAEHQRVVASGSKDEGILCHIWPAPPKVEGRIN